MNDFTKEELQLIYRNSSPCVSDEMMPVLEKIQSMIDNYWLPEDFVLIGTGQLLFHNKESSTAIIPKISSQIDVCENLDETKCFRIDWKIIYGKRFGQ